MFRCAGKLALDSRRVRLGQQSSWLSLTRQRTNAAERSLRPLVISRNSGGTRSVHGTESKMALASLFGTWRAQDLNPLQTCRPLGVSEMRGK